FQRFRDLRNGPTLDLFRYGGDTDAYRFAVHADHVGYRDQHFDGAYNDFGKLKISFDWNQLPLFFSRDTATLYTSPSPGVLLLPDAIQSALQSNTATLTSVVGGASPFDLRLKRDVALFKLTYTGIKS